MAGLFFCLASAEGAGLFCPPAIQPHTSVYSVFCRVNAIIPPTPQNSAQGFTSAFPTIAPAQPPTIPDRHNKPLHHLRHAGAPASARTRSTDTRYHYHAGTQHRSVQTAYYNNVYKGANHASPAGSRCFPRPAAGCLAPGQRSGLTGWHPPPGGEVQRQGQGGRCGTIDGFRRSSFRAFAR